MEVPSDPASGFSGFITPWGPLPWEQLPPAGRRAGGASRPGLTPPQGPAGSLAVSPCLRHAAARVRHELEGPLRGGLLRGVQLRRERRVQHRRGREGRRRGLRAGAPLPPAGLSESRKLDIVGRVQILAMPLVSSDFGSLSASALSSVK